MSGEFLIIGKYIAGRNPDDQVYVSLTSDRESILARISLQTISVSEDMSTGSPVCVMNFIDGNSRLMSDAKLDYDAEYFLEIGNNPLNSNVTLPLKLSGIDFTNSGDLGSPANENVSFRLTFVYSGWDKIINERKSRSWGSVRYSDVVNDIASECGYTSVDVEQTNSIRDSVIQPYISNLGMIRYIQKRAKSKEFDDICEFGVDMSGHFFFKSISRLISEQMSDAINGNIPSITLKPTQIDYQARLDEKKENLGIPSTFYVFNGNEDYVSNTISGGGGVKASYYDFEKDEYVTSDIIYRDFDSYQLADFTPVKRVHEDTNKLMYSGSNNEFENIAKADVSEIINSYAQLSISMEGTTDISIGRMVELIFPTPVNGFSSSPYSEVYSGFFIVAGVEHLFDMGVNSYVTILRLVRNGYSGKFLDGYSKTTLGKFTKS